MNKNYKIIDYFTGEDLFRECDFIEATLNNEILSQELNISLPILNLTVVLNNDVFLFYKKNTLRRAVKVIMGDIYTFDGILEPLSFIYLDGERVALEIKSALSLLSLESDTIIWEGFIKEFSATPIFNKTGEDIFSNIVVFVNNLLPSNLRILKINNELSDNLNDTSMTFLIPENTNIFDIITRLLYEFSLYIYWEDGIVVKDIKSNFNKEYKSFHKCIVRDSYSIERVNPSKNRLVIIFTDKRYKTVVEAIEEDIKGVWNEIGTRDETNKTNPVKPLFENQYYPENSLEYEERKYITKGFLVDMLVDIKSENKVLITSKDLITEISPILLIQDPVILFNPYNEWFEDIEDTKYIKSKTDLIKEYKIAPNSKAYQMLEKYYETDKSEWKPSSREKSYLILREFKSGSDWISYSFWHQPREAWDVSDPKVININWIQVVASTHYRNVEYTLRSGEKYFTREELKELYLYINTLTRAREEYRFRQHILFNGYQTIKFTSKERLKLLDKYKIFNPRGEEFITWIIAEYIEIDYNKMVRYSYIGYIVFDLKAIPTYPTIITSKTLDIGRKEEPLFLKTHWDTNLKSTIWEHWYIDDVPAIAFERVKNAYLTLYGYLTFYVINRLPLEKDIVYRAYGEGENLFFLTPKNEIEKVKEYYKEEFKREIKAEAITGVISKTANKKHKVIGGWEGQNIGGTVYYALPFRSDFMLKK